MPKSKSLDVIARALLHEDYSEFLDSYEIEKNGEISSQKTFDPQRYDISSYGFYFSEYSLMSDLNVTYEQAVLLKDVIGKCYSKSFKGYHGNIVLTELDRLSTGLRAIDKNAKMVRIMGEWPIRFYARLEEQKTVAYKSGKVLTTNCLQFDGFELLSEKYFLNRSNVSHYLGLILSEFRAFYDLLFLENVLNVDDKAPNFVSQFIIDTYEHHRPVISEARMGNAKVFLPRSELTGIISSPGRFSDNLRYFRKLRGWSQEDLSERSGISTRTISSYENESSVPWLSSIIKLAKALGVEVSVLIE